MVVGEAQVVTVEWTVCVEILTLVEIKGMVERACLYLTISVEVVKMKVETLAPPLGAARAVAAKRSTGRRDIGNMMMMLKMFLGE